MKEIFVVLPVYNESEVINEVISEINDHGFHNIIVVDDGSEDDTFEKIASNENVLLLRHKINRGKGAAIKTGIVAACELEADVVVTMDGDGQHDPADITTLIKPIVNGGCDVVLGTRMVQPDGMPLVKIIANKIGNICTLLFYGILVSDSQSGFRAYSRYAADIIDTRADKYEYDSKVIREINKKFLRFTEVPIMVRYTEYSMNKPVKQGFVNGLKTLTRMIWDKLV